MSKAPRQSLYQQVMGPEFDRLPAPLRRFHALEGRHLLVGRVQTEAPRSWPARLLARSLGTPLTAQEGAIHFELEAGEASELWTRRFPAKVMRSTMTVRAQRIVERLGPARLGFVLKGSADKLEMQLAGLHFLGIPCPRWLLPRIVAQETATAGRLHFHVQASLPWIGTVTSYRGHLELPQEAPS